MAISTPEEFFAILERSRLLSDDQFAAARQSVIGEGDDPNHIARVLVRGNFLTRWQAGQLLAGRSTFRLGKYKLIELLGRGGMGSVFLAEHVNMNRRVALKVLARELGKESGALDRFLAEARAAASLDHPNIVHAFNVDAEGNRYYLVMEYVEGVDLLRLVEAEGPLDYARAADYIRQAAEGLAHAHQQRMIHCDIKPSNLLINSQGVVKILDLGLARTIEEDGQAGGHDENVLGSVDYLAPEQALNGPSFDHRADIYSLGCTLYFALTGHPPFPDGTLTERLMKHQTREPQSIETQRANVPPQLIAVCRKMMAKDPADRYQTAKEVADALKSLDYSTRPLKQAVPLRRRQDSVAADEAGLESIPLLMELEKASAEAFQATAAVSGAHPLLRAPTPPAPEPGLLGTPARVGVFVTIVVLVAVAVLTAVFVGTSGTRGPQGKVAVDGKGTSSVPDANASPDTPGTLPSNSTQNPSSVIPPTPGPGTSGTSPPKPSTEAGASGIAAARGTEAGGTGTSNVAAPRPTSIPGTSPKPIAPIRTPPKGRQPPKQAITGNGKAPVTPANPVSPDVPTPSDTGPEAAPAEPIVMKGALDDLPETVSLPDLPTSDSDAPTPFSIGPVAPTGEATVTVELLGGDTAIKGPTSMFTLESNEVESGWDIFRAPRPGVAGSSIAVAHLAIRENELQFEWRGAAIRERGANLGNCGLKISVGEASRFIALSKPGTVDALKMNLANFRFEPVDIRLMNPPVTTAIRLELTSWSNPPWTASIPSEAMQFAALPDRRIEAEGRLLKLLAAAHDRGDFLIEINGEVDTGKIHLTALLLRQPPSGSQREIRRVDVRDLYPNGPPGARSPGQGTPKSIALPAIQYRVFLPMGDEKLVLFESQ